jgi:hypothetical protein
MPRNAFVVIEEIAATVNDRSIAVDFYAFRMMRRVTVDAVDATAVDERMGERALRSRNSIPPIATPVNRGDDDVFGAPILGYPCGCISGGFGRQLGQHVDAGLVFPSRPNEWNPTRLATEREHQYASFRAEVHDRGCRCLGAIAAGARRGQTHVAQRFERLEQSRVTEVEHVIVGQDTTVEASGCQPTGIVRMHSIARIAGVRQHLVDSSTRHDVSCQEELDHSKVSLCNAQLTLIADPVVQHRLRHPCCHAASWQASESYSASPSISLGVAL